MKVAVIHDYLNQYGGAERVLEALLDMFPSAHLYTLIYSRERTYGRFHKNLYKTSMLDFPLARRNHRPFIPFMPLATRSLAVQDGYDLIISDSAGYAKGVPHPPGIFHLSYCYTPLRYAWEIDHYFANPLFKTIFRPAFDYLRRWDFAAAQRPDVFLAVSGYIAGKMRRYYGREAAVVYPPVDYSRFYFDPGRQPSPSRPTYYLAAGRLMHYKRFDLVLDAFRDLRLPLVVVGIGPEQEALRRQAAGVQNIRFQETASDSELCALYNGARAFIFPQVEDFGLVAAEAQACGAPVIAYRKGGALEIVQEGVTGLFFDSQSPSSLIETLRRAESMSFDRERIGLLSRRFSVESFKQGVLSHIPRQILEIEN
jgi:glycosyltransferase involved in cell wall biosynthesis